MATATQPNDQKFKELILYIAKRCQSDPRFGRVKLNKILFFSDFIAFQQLHRPITGQEYMKLQYGPVPRRIRDVMKELQDERAVEEHRQQLDEERVLMKPLALREPDLTAFDQGELLIVNAVIETCCEMSSKEISDASHLLLGWRAARSEETIPYETVLLDPRPLSASEVRHGKKLAAETAAAA